MDRAALLKPRLEEDDVEIPDVGTVRVRGLSRYELMVSQRVSQNKGGTVVMEQHMLHFGMVDPMLTIEDVSLWQKASPAGEIEPVARRISELSGLREGSDKEAYKSVPGESDAGIRVLPGAEAVDDSGPDAPSDVL